MQVCSQLASTAKRLPPDQGLPIIEVMLDRIWDHDPHIPHLLWWAIESKAESPEGRKFIQKCFDNRSFWEGDPPVESQPPNATILMIAERIVQRYAMAGGDENLRMCARLLRAAPRQAAINIVLSGLEKAFAGRAASSFPDDLKTAVAAALAHDAKGEHLALGVRVGHPGAVASALAVVSDEKANKDRRLEFIRMFGEVLQPSAVPPLVKVLRESQFHTVRIAAMTALQRYDEPRVAETVLDLYAGAWKNEAELRATAQTLLASRAAWALAFVQAIDSGRIPARSVPLDLVRTLKRYSDDRIVKLASKHWGQVRAATPDEKRKAMAALAELVKPGKGDATAGKLVFTNTCGKCHKLFGEGAAVGPDLTGYERDNLGYWIENIVDPSASIRDEYLAFVVDTKDGRSLTGIIAAQDKATVTLKLPDGQTVRLARDQIEELRASPISLMPEDVLKDLKDQQLRDLFAYLMTKPKK